MEGRKDAITEDDARKIIEESLHVLFYREARSLSKVGPSSRRADINVNHPSSTKLLRFDKGVNISESRTLETYWSFAAGIRSYGAQVKCFQDTVM
jgi:20S proteasome subunit beta 7